MESMNRRSFIRLMSAAGVAARFHPRDLARAGSNERPNILVITSDQHHPRMAGYLGHPHVKTPNLDALVADGTVFRRAYCASPVCTPSRACFLTGQHVHRNRTWMIGVPTDPDIMTWPRRLTNAGYETAGYGKTDLCGKYQNPGFNDFITLERRPAFYPYPLDSPYEPRLTGYVRPDKRRHILEAESNLEARRMLSEKYGQEDFLFRFFDHRVLGFNPHDREVTEMALQFLRRSRRMRSGKPWALYLGYLQPHWPYRVPQHYFDMYYPDKLAWPHDARFPNETLHPEMHNFQKALGIEGIPEDAIRRTIAAYYGMITCLDDLIGVVVQELKRLGMYDNTYIIYTSDHGESLGEHGLFYKQCSYEGSVGVPLIMKGPGIPQNKVIDHTVSLVDEYPTLMEMAGLQTEDDRQGHSWLPMANDDFSDYPDYAFAEYHGNFIRQSWYMLARGPYKYTYYSNHMRPSLFNIEEDPVENVDLALGGTHDNVLKNFESLLHSILDPEKTAFESKRDLGLIGPNDEDYTITLTQQALKEGREKGKFRPRYKRGFLL
ncbi:MAG: sulfatase-like hydrolase/transferase [Deltaproteobacteria bacterium]|nr:sulfatase-like hydrolase/transferase [Deltaproteobacteria bacterium]